jgi:hypothetical protein
MGGGRAEKLSKTLVLVGWVEAGSRLETGSLTPAEKGGGLTEGWIHRICTCARAADTSQISCIVNGVFVPRERTEVGSAREFFRGKARGAAYGERTGWWSYEGETVPPRKCVLVG